MTTRLRLLFLLVSAVAVTPGGASASGPGSDPVRIPGHVLSVLDSATPTSQRSALSPASEPLTLTIVLRRDDEDGFERFLADVYDPASPRFGQFLTPVELAEQFGPTEASYDAVRAHFEQQGFVLTQGSDDRMTLTMVGARGQAERTLAVHIGDYTLGERRFYANDADPALPAELAAKVQAIDGLSSLGEPHRIATDAERQAIAGFCLLITNPMNWSVENIFFGEVFGEAFLLNPIFPGIFFGCLLVDLEFILNPTGGPGPGPYNGPSGGGGSFAVTRAAPLPRAGADGTGQTIGLLEYDTFQTSDVADLLTLLGLPASRLSHLSQVHLNGGAPLGAGENEVLLDVDLALNVAPGAAVAVYDAPLTTSYQTLFNAMIDDHVTIISNSWSACEDQVSLAKVQSIDAILKTAAAAGITVLNASGDSASTCLDGSPNTIGVPADAPSATAVGGTTLHAGDAAVYGTETWWDHGGFGTSRFFPRPSYQDGASAAATRSVPDVAIAADPQNGMVLCQADSGGCPSGLIFGGTSMSAPLFASYTALLNDSLGRNLGFLNPVIYPLAATSAFHSGASMGSDFAHVGLGSPNLDVLARSLAHQTLGAADAAASEVVISSLKIAGADILPITKVPADGTSAATVTVTVRDTNGHRVAGTPVTLAKNAGSHAVIAPAGGGVTSESNGTVVFTVTDLTAESTTFTATAGGSPLPKTAGLAFGVPPAAGAGIAAEPSTVTADGVATATITVTLQDALGRPTPGKSVTLAQGGGHSLIVAPNPAVTDANGQIAFTASDLVTETVTYTAVDTSDGDLPVPGNAQVAFTNGSGNACGDNVMPPVGMNGYTVTPYATGFAAGTLSFGGINFGGCAGISLPAFHGDDVYVLDGLNGDVFELGLAGGAASSTDKLTTIGPTLGWPTIGADGHLYATRTSTGGSPTTGVVVELDRDTGAIVRTLASGQTCPSALAVDPLSGDLFFDDICFNGPNNPALFRIRNPYSATPTVETYATLPTTPNGQISFAPNGTIYVAVGYTQASPGVARVTGTNGPTPPTVSTITGLVSNFWAGVAGVDATGEATALVTFDPTNTLAQLTDITVDPPVSTTLATNLGGGTIGPDGCLYVSASNVIYKVTGPGGACGFAPTSAAPSVTLTPTAVAPNPAQGTTQTFTATLRNTTPNADARMTFLVTGANPEIKQVAIAADGTASFDHVGVHVGADEIVASTTVASTALDSNPARITWATGKHVTFLSLDPSPASALPSAAVTVRAVLTDVSVQPSAAIGGVSVHFDVAGGSCDGVTDGSGTASCELTPSGAAGITTLSASFAGNAQYTPADASTAFMLVSPVPDLDAFACYKAAPAKAPKGAAPFPVFTPATVNVTDRFFPHELDLKKRIEVCNPADENAGDATAPDHATHLAAYAAKLTATHPAQPKPTPSIHTIVNPIGVLKLKVGTVDRLLAPAAKVLGTGGTPPLGATTVDHFQCYKVTVAKAKHGQPAFPKFTLTTVTLTDELGGPHAYDLKKPTRLCAPADKNGEAPGAEGHENHLVCYKAALTKEKPAQPKFVRATVSTNDQFGPGVLNLKSFDELCVPSLKLD